MSSLILLATIAQQVRKQWTEPAGQGVSKWLFLGQTAASVGFTIYSALLRNWIFTLTNALLLLSAILGLVITVVRRRSGPRAAEQRNCEAPVSNRALAVSIADRP